MTKLKLLKYLAIFSLPLALSACTVTDIYSDQNLTPASGGLAGDQSQLRESVDKTAILALADGAIGSAIARKLGEESRRDALSAEYDALEYTPSGESVRWRNETTGNYGVVTPSQTYDMGNMNCRKYTHIVYIDKKPVTATGTACKEQDGSWKPLA